MLRLVRYKSTRLPPKSLIIKQNSRLNKKNTENSKVVISSLRDVISLFQANSQTQEDDDLETLNHEMYLLQQIESGEVERLLKTKFQIDESKQLLSTGALIKKFPQLSKDELELIKKVNDLENIKPWSQIPQFVKQAQFYLSYGSYGPRLDLPFKANEKPLDFTYVNRARKQFGQEPYKRLKKDQLVNIYEITPTRQKYFNDKTVDPLSRFFIWTAIAVSAVVGWKEYKLREDGESLVTVVDKDSRETM